MKILKYFLTAIISIIVILYLLNALVNSINYSVYWFTKVSAIATAFAAVGGICLLIATVWYVLETRKMVTEVQRQKEPAITVRFAPDKHTNHFINVVLKNTGGGPAYDISVTFEPDLPYRKGGSLNKLNVFKRLPLLESGESYEFFFNSADDYLKSDSPKKSKANIQYYALPLDTNPSPLPKNRSIEIDLEERKGQLYVHRHDLHSLVEEMEDLKQNMVMLLADRKKDANS
ncbi:MAG: hypothetical protein COW85_07255 [Ignavibacteria bacterium CG22_combo_CG10-13_8_21_14_all_37_15]|nr:hypothetical protein [Ignavibacteria bacterium]OIO13821.1 MAG: hypothetical protein AUJ54_15485 [Ignavibacteria bacterium CG1_02_37_35]PIP77771.1 MAG: hypothetical protein COW85_07255 [Ignavibacteria bacterium CG22_combo_CG10-13_8_21_14_all_37_15]PIX93382.1 MAG: hypothetical protein COZ25_11015 [Ignavibacteria bacterium CG_4_10_14_3_um_filter_37_18]PJC60453.1 MAG: hypothetical protein CO025_03155 [Ignavibacteria bacterium CG_4_9_14_0_2_um_filter_37_13]